ncbi:TraB/GumN family protein [Paenibacillus alkaliterrae]|uniref:TraB/GumN family protein n=1 Tax=Paenibacillus alkaliterrae TaxID=320909 RepID=UPI001F2CE753|nr:TraB/GumN family protein [Paenibacillus alkaliterrae]MCF2939440.1 TraB/GumN family protein [Paenibacillus alkaliterrae]
MKKIAALFLSFALLFSFVTSVQAEAKPISVWVGEEQIQLGESEPILEKGTTLVPAKLILEELDFTVDWDQANKAVIAEKGGLVLALQIGNHTAYVNNAEKQLLVAPKIIEGTTYVPLRFVSEAAGYVVSWSSEQRTVSLEATEASRGFLWKVENAGNTVYLLGSIHIANEAMYPLRSEILNAYKESDYLVVEADISKANDPKIQELVLDLSTYKDGTTLKDHVSAETYEKIGKILAEIGLAANALDAYKPWSVSNTISYFAANKEGFDPAIGIDAYFLQQAIVSQQPIIELESFELQLKMFDEFSDELQEEMLDGSIESYYAENSDIEAVSEMWVTGNEEQLLALTLDTATNGELYKALLEDRNIPMVDKVKSYLNEKEGKTYFVVVGAAHMLGEHGLVPLLEKAGFTVTRQ